MDRTDNQLQRPEQMSWVDYCDSLGNEHSWPKMQQRPAFQVPGRTQDHNASLPSRQEQATELA